MLDPDSLRPEDRVLVLGRAAPELLLAAARRLTGGLMVVMADADAVTEGRRALRESENVLFAPLDEHAIPWRDGFFNVVVDLKHDWPDAASMEREIARVQAASH